ncbi:MAG: hypothetical protein JXP34_24175 [Planctomycetes bacterium]|nr:hypothetical protein [Planctomycetota bacterium]
MSLDIPRDHPLRDLFRGATREALGRLPALDDPGVAAHISDEILSSLVHVDRIYRLRDRRGRRLTELAEMTAEGRLPPRASGFERQLEVRQHIGDFALFMTGLFPETLERWGSRPEQALVAKVGSVLVPFRRMVDYYIAEGRSAYAATSAMVRPLDADRSRVFGRLAERFEAYMEVMGLIRGSLSSRAFFREVEGLIL